MRPGIIKIAPADPARKSKLNIDDLENIPTIENVIIEQNNQNVEGLITPSRQALMAHRRKSRTLVPSAS